MNQTPDKYDRAIQYLTENPSEISDAWYMPNDHQAGCLFKFCTKSGRSEGNCGCLVSVRNSTAVACSVELTNEIRSDEKIPDEKEGITVESLDHFATWQRRLDKELGRV